VAWLSCHIVAAAAAGSDQPAVVNKDVARSLTEAKTQADKKQWESALDALQKAEQVRDKSPYAEYKIDEFRAYVLTQQREYAAAAPVYAKLGESQQASREERARHWKTASQLFLQSKQHAKAGDAAGRALALNPGDTALLELSGESLYLAGEFKRSAQALEALLDAIRKKGDKPQEDWLQILLSSYHKLGDEQRIARTWETLLRYYPRPDYWRRVLMMKTDAEQPEALALAYRQLKFDLGLLSRPDDYEELAMGSIEAGAPALAVRVLQSGLEKGALAGANEARFRRMLAYARDEAAKSKAFLPQMAQQAQRASTGLASVALGRAYLGFQQYDEAIAAMRGGIEKGQLDDPDQARLYLGIAYLKRDQREHARHAFAAVDAESRWRELAQLWSLRTNNVDSR
jgi:hypothetical protein